MSDATFLLRGGLPPGRRTVAADLGIPGAREAAAPGLLAREDVVVDRPLGARHLVEHFDAVAVGIAQVDAERDAMVGDVVYRLALSLDLPVERLEVVETLEAPGHVVQADLALLLQRRILAQLHQ